MKGPGPILAVALLLGACANMPLTESGFLEHYEQLEDAPERTVWGVPDAMRFSQSTDVDWSAYGRIFIEPVRFVPANVRAEAVPAEDRAELLSDFEAALREELGEGFAVADAPGPGVLVLRAAVTDAEPATPWINWVMVVLLVPVSYGGVSGEMEVVDSDGRRLAAMTAAREGTAFLLLECFSRWGHAHHSMEKWGAEWRRILQRDDGPPRRAGVPASAAPAIRASGGRESGGREPSGVAAR